MNTYIISYDLRKSGRNYDALYRVMKSFPNWGHILESTWVVQTKLSAMAVREKLRAVMDSNDGLAVVRSGGEAAWANIICKNEWLKEYV